jgi:hypothetical protein
MFEPTIDAPALAAALSIQSGSGAEADDLLETALGLLEDAFEDAWRPVPVDVANDCVVRVARSLREGKKAANAGQLAKTSNGDRVASARAHADPIESVRHILTRYVVLL